MNEVNTLENCMKKGDLVRNSRTNSSKFAEVMEMGKCSIKVWTSKGDTEFWKPSECIVFATKASA